MKSAAPHAHASTADDWQCPRPVVQNGKPVTDTQWPAPTAMAPGGTGTLVAGAPELNGGTSITAKSPVHVTGPSVYIAGPMTGFEEHNYPLFNALATYLRDEGFVVKNPAENFGGDQTRKLYEYIELDLEMLIDAEGIVLMPGWRDSEGARMEATVAKALNHKFYEARLADGEICNLTDPAAWTVEPGDAPASTEAEGIESEARALVWGARGNDYGKPRQDFARIAGMWSAMLDISITPEQALAMMIALKVARLMQTPDHHDSIVDICGYAICYQRCLDDV